MARGSRWLEKAMWQFADFTFDTDDRRLLRGGEEVELSPRAFAVLGHLLERRGRVATKQELLDRVWSDVTVSEAVLKVAIAQIRRALGDDARNAAFVRTVHRVGYRFIADVVELGEAGSGSRHFPSRIVGREESLASLAADLERALAGSRVAVFASGEAGIGKTTLVDGFVGAASDRGAWVACGSCRESYGEGEAFLPLLEVLAALVRAGDGRQTLDLLRRHAPSWLQQMPWFLDEDERRAPEPGARGPSRARMLREVAEAMEAACRLRPVVLIFEDLHWSDPSTLDALSALIQREGPARLMILGTYRPGDASRAEHPVGDLVDRTATAGTSRRLILEALEREEVQSYLRARLDGTVSERVGDLVHRHSDGNPLFMVSCVAELLAQGHLTDSDGTWSLAGDADEIEAIFPEELRSVLDQRFAGVDARQLRLLEIASVFGPEFTSQQIAAIDCTGTGSVEETLDSLAMSDPLVRPVGSEPPGPGGVAIRYRFSHVLQQRAVHRSIGPGRKMRLHGQVADFLAEAGENPGHIAFHFDAAHRFDRAVEYWHLAGTRALEQWAHHEALGHFERALAAIPQLPRDAERDRLELQLLVKSVGPIRAIYGPGSERIAQRFDRAVEIGDTLADGPELYPFWGALFSYYIATTRLVEAEELADRMIAIAEPLGPGILLQSTLLMRGVVSLYRGRLEAAVQDMDRSLALASAEPLYFMGAENQAFAYLFSSLALQLIGRSGEALARTERGRKMALEGDDPELLTMALQFQSSVARWQGNTALAGTRAEQIEAVCAEEGIEQWASVTGWILGWVRARQSGAASAIDALCENLAAYREVGTEASRTEYLAATAEVCAEAGEVDRGLELVAEALARVESCDERFAEAEIHRVRGVLLETRARSSTGAAAERDRSEARDAVRKAIDIARAQGALFWELRAQLTRADLREEDASLDGVRGDLGRILTGLDPGVDLPELRKARALLGT